MFSSILISDHQEAPLSRPMAHSLHLLPLQHLGFNPLPATPTVYGFYEIFGGFRWVSYMQGLDTRVSPWKTINYLWWLFVVFLNFTGSHNGLIQIFETCKSYLNILSQQNLASV